MIDILLTHTYHLQYDSKQKQKMQPYRPLGTLYAASALRGKGLTVALFDTMMRDPNEFSSFLDETKPKIVAIYEDDFNFLTKMCLSRMREVAWTFAQMARDRKIPVVIHGSDASDNPDIFLDRGVDYLLRGEAEAALTDLCLAIINHSSTNQIPGLILRTGPGTTVHPAQSLSLNPGWARLSIPPLDLTDFALYQEAWTRAHGYFSVNMVASRGCPFRCNWCAKPISGNRFHSRPAADVAEEMRLLKSTIHADHIWFSDDVFALNHHWVQDFAREVTARHAMIPFKIQSRADLITDQTVEALKQAGCKEVWMGVESGSQKILDAMDKGLTISDIEDARRRLKYAGIRACYFLQFGYPGERWPELQQTIKFVRDTRPDDIGISFSYPLPGTVFYERTRAELGSKRNWIESDDLCMLFKAEYTTDFYRAVRNALHAEVDNWTTPSRDADLLWDEVHRLEPTSRARNIEEPVSRSMGFVSLDRLTIKVGA
ncbi:B12-binding domain-containing radical SAM protein [Edaphobacter albus]|uniref:B12-binding domain-containing radical SAM protein n=1 Tax=Edaphobacter sp. 4G125 TaxID=2763071 RepID=UPI00164493E6|nr:radical SAM protein [Edaphobacter sp. 4G125]QNI37660.1 B12-binding domain-containing radical SAM protein [Edaphobacter sp. 4G125]